MMTNPYLENMVKTASPVKLVILLYDRAISSLKTALELMEKRENTPEGLKKKLEALSKAADILATLDGTLNFEKGGEIAQKLHEIYDIFLDDLIVLSTKDHPETLRKMITILEDLRKAWEEVEKEVKVNGKNRREAPRKVSDARSQGLVATL